MNQLYREDHCMGDNNFFNQFEDKINDYRMAELHLDGLDINEDLRSIQHDSVYMTDGEIEDAVEKVNSFEKHIFGRVGR